MLVTLAGLHKLIYGPRLVAAAGIDHPCVLCVMVLTHLGGAATHATEFLVGDRLPGDCPRLVLVGEVEPLGASESEGERGAGLHQLIWGVGYPSRYRGRLGFPAFWSARTSRNISCHAPSLISSAHASQSFGMGLPSRSVVAVMAAWRRASPNVSVL